MKNEEAAGFKVPAASSQSNCHKSHNNTGMSRKDEFDFKGDALGLEIKEVESGNASFKSS